MNTAIGVVFLIISIVTFILSIRQFLQKGNLYSVSYFATPKGEREELKSPKSYHYSAWLLFHTAFICGFLGLFFITFYLPFAYLSAIFAFSEILACSIFIFTNR